MEENKKMIKVKEPKIKMSSDKLAMIIIISLVIVVTGALFGFFYYNNNMKAVVSFSGGKLAISEYNIYYKIFSPMLSNYGYPADIIPEEIAKKAGSDKIILNEAKAQGIKLSAENKEKVDEIFKNKDQIKQFTDSGIDVGKIKELYYNDYVISQYIDKIKTDIKADEMTTYLKTTYGDTVDMNEYITRHILFKTTDSSGAEMTAEQKAVVKTKAEAALVRALAGEDFAKLATELSEDTGTKVNGGEYKMYSDGKTFEPYTNAVKALGVGKITTSLVESTAGYHIIKLDSINAQGRVNSDTERQNLASEKIDKLSVDKSIKVNTELLKKVVEKITGVKATTETTDTNKTTTTTGK